MGCSTHNVPSLSNVAIRSGGATKSALVAMVTQPTNWMMACFAGVSFQDGKGSLCAETQDEEAPIANPKTATASR